MYIIVQDILNEQCSDIKDFDCFQGVSGVVTFLKETRKGYEELGTMDFDGTWPIKEEE